MTGQLTNRNNNGKQTSNEQTFNEKEIKKDLDLLILDGKKISDGFKVTLKKKLNNSTEQKHLQDLLSTINNYKKEKTRLQNSLDEITKNLTKKQKSKVSDKILSINGIIHKLMSVCKNYQNEAKKKFGLKHAERFTGHTQKKNQSLFKDDELMENTKTMPEVDKAFKDINNLRKEILEKKKDIRKSLRNNIYHNYHDRPTWYILNNLNEKLHSKQTKIGNSFTAIKFLKIEIIEKKIMDNKIHQRLKNITDSFHKSIINEDKKAEMETSQVHSTLKNKKKIGLQILSHVNRLEPIEFYKETKKRYLHNLHTELCRRIKKVDYFDHMNNQKGDQKDDHIVIKNKIKKRKKKRKKKKNSKEEKNKLKNLFFETVKTNPIKLGKNNRIDEALIEHRNEILKDRFHLFEFSPYRKRNSKIRNNSRLLVTYRILLI